MGKIMIIEEKADKMVDKLEMMKDCVEEMIDCFTEATEGHRYPEDDEWDDEYEVNHRRDSRGGNSRSMRRRMRGTGGYNGGTSRY